VFISGKIINLIVISVPLLGKNLL